MLRPDFVRLAWIACGAAVASLIASTAVQLLPGALIFLRYGPMD